VRKTVELPPRERKATSGSVWPTLRSKATGRPPNERCASTTVFGSVFVAWLVAPGEREHASPEIEAAARSASTSAEPRTARRGTETERTVDMKILLKRR
jgi:hypothetical protein